MNKRFNEFGNAALIVIIFLLLIGGGYFLVKVRPGKVGSKPTVSPSPTAEIEESPTPESEELSATPIKPSPTAVEDEEKKAEPTKASEDKSPGKIEGTLGYPSEGIPPLEVYAIPAAGKGKYFFIKTYQNQGKFEIEDVEPGSYYIVAYSNNLSGAYSKAVPCGLSVDCKDHSLIAVEVKSGQTAGGAEVRDWYAPEGTFPKKPQ